MDIVIIIYTVHIYPQQSAYEKGVGMNILDSSNTSLQSG